MKFSLSDDSALAIQSYHPGGFKIGGRELQGSQLLFSDQQPTRWPVASMENLQEIDLQALQQSQADTVIIGTGSTLVFPADELLAGFFSRQIGVEIMDTAAACRTYNILLGEGRNVSAGLIAI